MEQLFQPLIVALQATQQDAVVISEGEESASDPAFGAGHAKVASTIVFNDTHAFKAQLFQESSRFTLDLQSVAVLPARAQSADIALK